MFDCTDLAVPQEVMHHVVQVESARNPYAIGVVGGYLAKQPKTLEEALFAVQALKDQGYNFSVGIAQVNRYNLAKYGISSYAQAFQVCPSLQAGSRILRECYDRARDWGKAFSCYYSGNFVTGYEHGYVQKIFASMQRGLRAHTQPETAGVRIIPYNSKAERKIAKDDGVPLGSTAVNAGLAASPNLPPNPQAAVQPVVVTTSQPVGAAPVASGAPIAKAMSVWQHPLLKTYPDARPIRSRLLAGLLQQYRLLVTVDANGALPGQMPESPDTAQRVSAQAAQSIFPNATPAQLQRLVPHPTMGLAALPATGAQAGAAMAGGELPKNGLTQTQSVHAAANRLPIPVQIVGSEGATAGGAPVLYTPPPASSAQSASGQNLPLPNPYTGAAPETRAGRSAVSSRAQVTVRKGGTLVQGSEPQRTLKESSGSPEQLAGARQTAPARISSDKSESTDKSFVF